MWLFLRHTFHQTVGATSPKEFKELVQYCAERKLELPSECDTQAVCTQLDLYAIQTQYDIPSSWLPTLVRAPCTQVDLYAIQTQRDITVTEVELCDLDSVRLSLLTSNIIRRHPSHESASTQFGLWGISESNVQLAGKSHESKRLCQSSVSCVFYVDISGKLSGMDVTRIIRKFFRNFK